MQGPDFLYLIVDEQGRSYTVDPVNGQVVMSTLPQPLEYTPDGWQEISISNERSDKYFTMDRSFSVPLKYVKDGATIIKKIRYQTGTETKLYQVILQQFVYVDETTYYYYYDYFYKAEIDLSTFTHDGPTVQVNLMEGGFPKMLKDNENTTWEIGLNEADPVKINMDGITLFGKQNMAFTDGVNYELGASGGKLWFPSTVMLTTEGRAPYLIIQSQQYQENFPGIADNFNITNWTAKVQENAPNPITFTVAGKIILQRVASNLPIDVRVFMHRIHLDTHTVDQIQIFQHGFTTDGEIFEQDFSQTLTLKQGEFIVFRLSFSTSGGASGRIAFQKGSNYMISYTSKYAPTFVDGIQESILFDKLIKRMTNNEYSGVYQLPVNPFCYITCGNWIRGLFSEDAKMKISWNQFWSWLDLKFDTAMYVQGKTVVLCLKKDSFDYNDFIDTGNITSPTITDNADKLFNLLELGYPDQDYTQQFGNDAINGRNEFNTKQQYKAPQTRVVRTLSYISEVRADCYGMEILRANLDGRETSDTSSDNDNFAVHVEQQIRTPIFGVGLLKYRNLDRTLNASATGIITPETIFNLALSPKQCLYRKGAYLRSCLAWLDNKKLIFQTTDKNSTLVVSSPVIVAESADVLVSSLEPRYFVPLLFEGTAPVPDNPILLLDQNPKKTIAATINGKRYKGISLKLGIQPATNAAQVYQFLSAPDNDFNNLINYEGE